jgi:hypothetical protein
MNPPPVIRASILLRAESELAKWLIETVRQRNQDDALPLYGMA